MFTNNILINYILIINNYFLKLYISIKPGSPEAFLDVRFSNQNRKVVEAFGISLPIRFQKYLYETHVGSSI